MKRYLKTFGVAFLAGVGAARVLIWLNIQWKEFQNLKFHLLQDEPIPL